MRFLVMHKNDPNTEAGEPPPMDLVHEMGKSTLDGSTCGSWKPRTRPSRVLKIRLDGSAAPPPGGLEESDHVMSTRDARPHNHAVLAPAGDRGILRRFKDSGH
jgi:hypothetical protein